MNFADFRRFLKTFLLLRHSGISLKTFHCYYNLSSVFDKQCKIERQETLKGCRVSVNLPLAILVDD